jgi:hypothetical protein
VNHRVRSELAKGQITPPHAAPHENGDAGMQTQLIHLGPVFSTSARGSECPVQTQFEKKWNIAVPAFHWTCSIEVPHESIFAWLIHINAT